MAIEIKFFNTELGAHEETRRRRGTWRPLRTEFINRKWRVTYVTGTDDPDNLPRPPKEQVTQSQLMERLAIEMGVELV